MSSQIVATFDPQAAASGAFNASFPNGIGDILVFNESNVNLILVWPGHEEYCPAWEAMPYHVESPQAQISWSQQSVLPTSGGAPIHQVVVIAYSGKLLGSYPAPLVRQTNIGNDVSLGQAVTSVANDGNGFHTRFVESTVNGRASSGVQVYNEGNIVLGNSTDFGQLVLNGNSNGSGTYMDQIDFGFGGCQIGTFGSNNGQIQVLSNGQVIISCANGNMSIAIDGINQIINFKVGATKVAHLDVNGNMVLKGTLTQNGNP